MAVTESMRRALCALETSLDPHTVLRQRQAAPMGAPVRLRCGGGAAHGHQQGLSLSGQEREQASNHTRRVKAQGLCASQRSSTHAVWDDRAQVPGAAHCDPVRRQARRLSSLSAGAIAPERTRWYAATEHTPLAPVYGPRSSRPCPCRVCSRGEPETVWPAGWLRRNTTAASEKAHVQRGVADRGAGSAIPLPGGCLGACAQAARGDEIVHAGEARHVMDCIPEDTTEHRANTRHSLEHRQGMRVMLLRRRDHGQRQSPEESIIVPKEGAGRLRCFAGQRDQATVPPPRHGGLWRRLACQSRAECPDRWCAGHGSRAPRVAVREGADAGADPAWPACRRERQTPGATGLPAGARQSVWASIVSFVAVPPWRACIERACPKTQGIPSRAQQVRQPVPGKETCDGDDQRLTGGGNRLEEQLRAGLHGAMQPDLAILAEETHVHAACVQSNAAIRFVLLWCTIA